MDTPCGCCGSFACFACGKCPNIHCECDAGPLLCECDMSGDWADASECPIHMRGGFLEMNLRVNL